MVVERICFKRRMLLECRSVCALLCWRANEVSACWYAIGEIMRELGTNVSVLQADRAFWGLTG